MKREADTKVLMAGLFSQNLAFFTMTYSDFKFTLCLNIIKEVAGYNYLSSVSEEESRILKAHLHLTTHTIHRDQLEGKRAMNSCSCWGQRTQDIIDIFLLIGKGNNSDCWEKGERTEL